MANSALRNSLSGVCSPVMPLAMPTLAWVKASCPSTPNGESSASPIRWAMRTPSTVSAVLAPWQRHRYGRRPTRHQEEDRREASHEGG
jgi:hypothetical protein